MAARMFLYAILMLSSANASELAKSNDAPKPGFAFSWLDDNNIFIAGDTATIKIKILGNFDPGGYEHAFIPVVSINGKAGNSTFISGLAMNFGGDPSSWTISFTPILDGVFNILITDAYFGVLDSSLHFYANPGPMHPAVSIASWMDSVNNFVAGTRGVVLILPKDAFGNNVPSTKAELNSYVFNISAFYTDGSPASVLSVTSLGWNTYGYLRIEFIAATAGNLLLHIERENQTLRGSPLPFKVIPGPLDISKCVANWNFETNTLQLFSKAEIFIHQLDQFGNLVPGLYTFDAEVVEKGTNLSIPVGDLLFSEMSPGIQLLSFTALETGNFLLMIYDVKHNQSISNMPYDFKVFVGYCDGSNSAINGSGLNSSVAGDMAKFSVFLNDEYQYPSPIELGNLRVQIMHETHSYSVLPAIHAIKTINGSRFPWQYSFDAISLVEVSPAPSMNQNNTSAGNSKILANAYEEVRAGDVNITLSGVVKYSPQVQKKMKNEIIVRLMDSFYNPVLGGQSKLKLEIGSINDSGFKTWTFVDNNDGSYIGHYLLKDVGSYELCASFDGHRFLPCPFGVNAYSSEYFPRAYDDSVSVWEDESIVFNALGNDYFAGGNATILELSHPLHGSVLQIGKLFRYTPYKGFYGNDSFSYTILDVNGNVATASVNISILSIPPQFVSFQAQLHATEDVISPKFGGFPGFEITYPNLTENISVTVSPKSGTVSLSPMLMQFWEPIWSGFSVIKVDEEVKGLALAGHVEVINIALQSIQYIGNENFYGEDTIKISTSNNNGVNDLNVSVFVEPVNDPPFIHTPDYILLEDNGHENGSLIYDQKRDKFEFLVGDPDLSNFPGDKSHFVVMFSMEVSSGVLEATLPAELINTTEIKLKNSYQWQPLQTFVTIARHFMVKAKGLRYHGTIDDCNSIIQQLKYHVHGGDYGTVLKMTVNDMGNYGCYPDCAENISKPLLVEADINLIKRRPMSSKAAQALGSAIIIEFIVVLSLGVILLFYTCKCAIALVNEQRSRPNSKKTTMTPGVQTSDEQTSSPNWLKKAASFAGCCQGTSEFSGKPFKFGQQLWPRTQGGASRKSAGRSSGSSGDQAPAASFRSLLIEKDAK
ncbi:hypothetical protein Nepgr_010134 [Nepenthes gracilis]|uniref:GEX2 N-terminal Ig-like domain-containing protein n=1 Tax=Nepenthes gracilis TaxID=150966 RepID=A0AAD3XL10_NEPGR|nr:hypothetical protein Nepgr_010134 [Nepenthes gracilis]